MTRRTLALLTCLLISGCALPSIATPRLTTSDDNADGPSATGVPTAAATASTDPAPSSTASPADIPTESGPAEGSGVVRLRTSTVLPFDERTTIDGLTLIVHRPVPADEAFRRRHDLPTVQALFTVEIFNDPQRPVDLDAYSFLLYRDRTQVRLDEAPYTSRTGSMDRQGHALPGGTQSILVALETSPDDSYMAGLVKRPKDGDPQLLALFSEDLPRADTHLVGPRQGRGLTVDVRGGASLTTGRGSRGH